MATTLQKGLSGGDPVAMQAEQQKQQADMQKMQMKQGAIQ